MEINLFDNKTIFQVHFFTSFPVVCVLYLPAPCTLALSCSTSTEWQILFPFNFCSFASFAFLLNLLSDCKTFKVNWEWIGGETAAGSEGWEWNCLRAHISISFKWKENGCCAVQQVNLFIECWDYMPSGSHRSKGFESKWRHRIAVDSLIRLWVGWAAGHIAIQAARIMVIMQRGDYQLEQQTWKHVSR